MDRKVLVIVLVISVAVNLATVFTLGYFWVMKPPACPGPGPETAMPQWQNARIVRDLGLSHEQMERIRMENEEMRGMMQPLRQELFEKRRELMSMLREDSMDRARADTLIERIARLQVEHDAQVFERLARIKAVLTPAQQDRLGGLLHQLLMERCPGEPRPMPMRRIGGPQVPRVDEGR